MRISIIVLLTLLIAASVVFLVYVILWNKNAMTAHMGEIRVEGNTDLSSSTNADTATATATAAATTAAATYPKTIQNLTQVFENIYFDIPNGNILEISTRVATEADKSEYLIQNIYSRDRGNKVDNTNNSKYIVNVKEITPTGSTADTMSSNYDHFSITIDTKQLFYIPWDTATYIHVIDLEGLIAVGKTAPQNMMSFCYDRTNDGPSNKSTSYSESIITIDTQSYTLNSYDGKTAILPIYGNMTIFKIVNNVFYDPTNGALITQTQSGINVYERKVMNSCATPTPLYIPNNSQQNAERSTNIMDVGFCSWVIQLDGFLIVYMGNGKKTVISILNRQTNEEEYSVVSVVRFLSNGTLDTGNSLASITTNPWSFTNNIYDTDIDINMLGLYEGGAGGAAGANAPRNPLSDYYKWTDYWNKVSGTDLYDKIPSNEYILKSQIVPPVCPRCPSCPNSGVCTTCGGNGGSGTQVNNKKKRKSKGSEEAEEEEEEEEEDEDDGLLEKAGSGTKDLLENAGSGTKDLLYDTASGVKGTAYDAASGAKGAVKDVYGEAKGVAKGVYGEAKGLAGGALGGVKDIAGGVKGLFQTGPTQIQPVHLGGAGTGYGRPPTATGRGMGIYANIPQTQGADFMTYFGALQPKGDANYIPVTADFSSFRK